MSELTWLIITGICLIIFVMISAFVYAIASVWIVRSTPEQLDQVLARLDLMEQRYKRLQEGMKRAGTWKSSWEIESPDLKIGGSG